MHLLSWKAFCLCSCHLLHPLIDEQYFVPFQEVGLFALLSDHPWRRRRRRRYKLRNHTRVLFYKYLSRKWRNINGVFWKALIKNQCVLRNVTSQRIGCYQEEWIGNLKFFTRVRKDKRYWRFTYNGLALIDYLLYLRPAWQRFSRFINLNGYLSLNSKPLYSSFSINNKQEKRKEMNLEIFSLICLLECFDVSSFIPSSIYVSEVNSSCLWS